MKFIYLSFDCIMVDYYYKTENRTRLGLQQNAVSFQRLKLKLKFSYWTLV